MEKLHLAGAATFIGPDDLAFTRDEAIDLLAGAVPESAAETLWTRTEGWAAGMRMAALSVRRCTDPAAFVAAFSGTDRAVAGYLIDEVLTQASGAVVSG